MTSPYATGGTVLQGTYEGDAGYLHVFDTVGGAGFVPLYVLNCTVVVIGGGGAGGTSSATVGSETSGGGGGAGGYGIQNFPTIDPLSIANYAITVGDGGLPPAIAGASAFIADNLPNPTYLMEAGAGAVGGNGVDGLNGDAPTNSPTYPFTGSGSGAGSTENAGTTPTNGGSGQTDGGSSENNPTVLPFTAGGGGGKAGSGFNYISGGVGGGGIANPFADFTGQPAKVCAGGGGGDIIGAAAATIG